MAKKKEVDPIDQRNKLLITAINKTINTNTVLPILEDVLLTPGFALVSDLETFVRVPFQMNGVPKDGIAVPAVMFKKILGMIPDPAVTVDNGLGCEFVSGKRKIKVLGDEPLNYPIMPGQGHGETFKPVGILTPEDTDRIALALKFVSNDDLRPAMTGILFSDEMVATDAHRLYHHKLGFKDEFILPAKAAKILLALGGGEWWVSRMDMNIHFERADGVTIISRAIDARFPDYKVVLPDVKDVRAKLISHPDTLMKELKNAQEFANRSTSQVTFSLNGKVGIHSCDVDFSFEYSNQLDGAEIHYNPKAPKRYADKETGEEVHVVKYIGKDKIKIRDQRTAELVDVSVSDYTELPPDFNIGFNGKFLQEIINCLPENTPVTMNLWGPTKAAIVNDDFLVMPLMLNS